MYKKTQFLVSLFVSLVISLPALADFKVGDFELVHTVPVETGLNTPDLRDPVTVWSEMIDGAKDQIVFGEFYVADQLGEPLGSVIKHLEDAARRGVQIRFLMEKKGLKASVPATIDRLKAIPNLTFKILEFAKVGGGIIHAKYFVVDKRLAYVGSQNFDWRSLKHIHETGLKISDEKIAKQVQQIFEFDWQAQDLIENGKPVPMLNKTVVSHSGNESSYLVASPNAYNPDGIGDSQSELVRLIGAAHDEIRVQLLDYSPTDYHHHLYPVIDNALRDAAIRGVKIKLMVSHWNTDKPAVDHLKSLSLIPGIEIRIVTLPQAKSGFIPFARVIHTKTMSIDGKVAWIGTSNWTGGYLDESRNLEIVMKSETMAKRIADLHEQTWASKFAERIDVMKDYPKPQKDFPKDAPKDGKKSS